MISTARCTREQMCELVRPVLAPDSRDKACVYWQACHGWMMDRWVLLPQPDEELNPEPEAEVGRVAWVKHSTRVIAYNIAPHLGFWECYDQFQCMYVPYPRRRGNYKVTWVGGPAPYGRRVELLSWTEVGCQVLLQVWGDVVGIVVDGYSDLHESEGLTNARKAAQHLVSNPKYGLPEGRILKLISAGQKEDVTAFMLAGILDSPLAARYDAVSLYDGEKFVVVTSRDKNIHVGDNYTRGAIGAND